MASDDSICIKDEHQAISSSPVNQGNMEELIIPNCTVESTTSENSAICVKEETQDASFYVLPENGGNAREFMAGTYPAASMSEAQKLLLLSLMEESPELCNNRSFMPGESKQQRRAKWDRIATSLNSVVGIRKDAIGWQLLWKNWRYRVRKNLRSNMNGGSGGAGNETSTPGEDGRVRVVDQAAHSLDARVMALVGWDTLSAIPGCSTVSASGTMTQQEATVAELSPAAQEPTPEDLMEVNQDAPAPVPTPAPAASTVTADRMSGDQRVRKENAGTNQRPAPARKRRRRVPAPIAQQILGLQRELVNEVSQLREVITSAISPISEYFKYKLEKEKGNS
ncbi:uncharacterized protein LOC135378733 [Ornithodoros turicata]|uniref:uncharacterized protein LOC135378733 n=1 Tax=Ornithodoros turicata TaxID=34597 RepID=UPI003138B634